MFKVTQVEPQKKNSKRFNVFLDGKFAFGADEDLVVNRRLIVGKEISEEDLEKILFEAEVGKLMERMYRLFNIRQRSEKEVRDYLKRLSFKRKIKEQDDISEVAVEFLIERLKTKGMINDQNFAYEWTRARRISKKKGKNAIKAELFQKGISKEVINEVISENGDEESIAYQALEKKMRVWKHLSEMEIRQKGIQFLVRRGFDYDLAKTVVEKVVRK